MVEVAARHVSATPLGVRAETSMASYCCGVWVVAWEVGRRDDDLGRGGCGLALFGIAHFGMREPEKRYAVAFVFAI